MLNADVPVPQVIGRFASYGTIFHTLLSEAATRSGQGTIIVFEDFDVVRGEYPADITRFDAILVTGSASSSYDEVPWIKVLDSYLSDVYENHPGRVLTFQGHSEFDRLSNWECIKIACETFDAQNREIALRRVDLDDDAVEIAEIVVYFLEANPQNSV